MSWVLAELLMLIPLSLMGGIVTLAVISHRADRRSAKLAPARLYLLDHPWEVEDADRSA